MLKNKIVYIQQAFNLKSILGGSKRKKKRIKPNTNKGIIFS